MKKVALYSLKRKNKILQIVRDRLKCINKIKTEEIKILNSCFK